VYAFSMHAHDLPTIDVREAARRLEQPSEGAAPLLVDVRELDEFTALRVPGAALLPISRFALGYRSLPTDRPLLMLCRSGSRSTMATDFLLRSGFPEVVNIRGGIMAWHAAQLPTRTGPVQPGEGDLPTDKADTPADA
jgi:rhodanese-related sulfurtransferase